MKIADKNTTAVSLVREALAKAKQYKDHNVFISMNEEAALQRAAAIDKQIAAGQPVGKLAGVPYALKDNFSSRDGNTTSAALILKPYQAPITATAVKRIEDEGAIMIGRTNLDAFGHGGSTENTIFGPTLNSHDRSRVAGGSSGGSAVAVALGIVPFALGSDTGGSIRQPASFNGVFGLRPTYGTVSRYGVAAMISSTDTIGAFTQDSADLALVMSILAGRDDYDPTTLDDFFTGELRPVTKGLKVGVISDFMTKDVDTEVVRAVQDYTAKLKKLGAEVSDVQMPILKYTLPIYYIDMFAEVASNLSRLDGIRYGYRSPDAQSLEQIYGKSRNEGFSAESKRRIMLGNFVLSSGFFDAYFLKAQKARTLLINAYNDAFDSYDVLICPVAPSPAFKVGQNTSDPIKMYLEDAMTVPPSLAGLPALSVPAGKTKSGLPIGAQLIGPRRSDDLLLSIADEVANV
jgi:aspartyl-tRNA(Asn)/glutamyl-tRNA(Gln) amidotransferase subunit A